MQPESKPDQTDGPESVRPPGDPAPPFAAAIPEPPATPSPTAPPSPAERPPLLSGPPTPPPGGAKSPGPALPDVAATPKPGLLGPVLPPPVVHQSTDTDTARGLDSDAPATTNIGTVKSSRPTTSRVMAIANQKGGVGKTTTSVNLAAALADLDYRTLLVDLDPQGNASTGLGVNPWSIQTSMYDVILQETPMEDCIEPTSVRNLFVAPANLDLAGAEVELVPAFSRELKLRNAINEVRDDYDYILIDCPPSLGLLTVNGLAAASEVLVPIQCEYYALEGLGQLLRNVELIKKNLNPGLEVSGLVLVMYDARTKLSDQVVTEVRSHFGSKVCRTIIPRSVRLSEAPSFGQPITVFDPNSRGAIAYRDLASEVANGPA